MSQIANIWDNKSITVFVPALYFEIFYFKLLTFKHICLQ